MEYTKLKVKLPIKKPYPFIGSKVRGLLGYTLKNNVCINPSLQCNGCFATDNCLFYKMYELQNTIHNYRFDIDLHDDDFKFFLYLFNDLQQDVNIITTSLSTALKHYGEIQIKQKSKKLKKKKNKKNTKIFKIEFLTPLRIKKNNRYVTKAAQIDIDDLLLSAHKRAYSLGIRKRKTFEFNRKSKIISTNLVFKHIKRRSKKQNRVMDFGGLMGEMIITNLNEDEYALLKIAEIIGIGKQTVFGLGKIKIRGIDV